MASPGTAEPGRVPARVTMVWDAVREAADALRSAAGAPLTILDVGGGTGGMSVPLATLGHHIVVADPSPDALAALQRRAAEAGVADRVRAVQADTADVRRALDSPTDLVDLVCCHGVLEHVDDPAAALASVAEVVRPGGIVSLVVPQRSGQVVARALAGRFVEAGRAMDDPDGRWGPADVVPRRFDLASLRDLIQAAGLRPGAVRGLRVFADLVPEALVDSTAARVALVDLERRAGDYDRHPEYVALAAQLHVIARR
ncbi:MAG: methyltransferase domain-containing protein [Angustibacter sp.]